jgi:hypothetical protein
LKTDAPKTLSVPEAGKRYFDLGKNASYEAARRGELPILRFGHKLRVSVAACERMLADAGPRSPSEDQCEKAVVGFLNVHGEPSKR